MLPCFWIPLNNLLLHITLNNLYFSELRCKASHVQSNFVHNGHVRKDFYKCFLLVFFFFFFWLGTLKIPQHNKLCMHFYISMYIYSQISISFTLSWHLSVLLHFYSLCQYFLTRHSTVCLYLIFPLNFFFFLAKLPNTFQSMCTYVLYMRFQCIKSFVFLPPDMYEAVVLAYYAIKPYFL